MVRDTWNHILSKSRSTTFRWETILLTALGILYFLASSNIYPAEDAVMLFDYSRNLADRGVITYGSGTAVPIEGATDFLYMLLVAILSKCGVSEFEAALSLNFLGIILICHVMLKSTQKIWVPLVAVIGTPYLYASLLGFSAMSFASVYMLAVYLLLNQDRRTYLAAIGMCLVRPDGVVWCIGIIAARLSSIEKSQRASDLKYLLGYFVAPGILYFIWRLWYFKEWLPLPFLVKSSGERSLAQILDALLPILIPTISVLLCADDRWRLTKTSIVLFSMPILFYSVMRLEQNTGNRFLSPLFFGMLLLVGTERSLRLIILFIFLSICLGYPMLSTALQNMAYTTNETSRPIGVRLQHLSRGKLLSTEAGNLAYYSTWTAEDSWGLNTPKYAHGLITTGEVAGGDYDLIVMHCDIGTLKSGRFPLTKATEVRSWANQCHSLEGFLRSSDYDVMLVPIVTSSTGKQADDSGSTCVRRLIYAISPHYKDHVQIRNMLMAFSAIPMNSSGNVYIGDAACSYSP